MPMQFSLSTADNGQKFVTAFIEGQLLQADSASHPNFLAIVGALQADFAGESIDPTEVRDLFDIPTAISRQFERLSTRVTVEDGQIMFDGDPAQPGLSNHILRLLEDGESVEPAVNFLEKVMDNPEPHSRAQLWTWLNNHDFTLTPEGDLIAYKGVYADGNGGYRSGRQGHAFVNDVEFKFDYIPNAVGDTVTMRRSEVVHDPSLACHAGLHVGTYDYARTYAQGALLRVIVNPRDVVSVPEDVKIRVCRYVVEAIIDAPDTKSVYRMDAFADEDDLGYDEDDYSDFVDNDDPTFYKGDRAYYIGNSSYLRGKDLVVLEDGPDSDGDVYVEVDGSYNDYIDAKDLDFA